MTDNNDEIQKIEEAIGKLDPSIQKQIEEINEVIQAISNQLLNVLEKALDQGAKPGAILGALGEVVASAFVSCNMTDEHIEQWCSILKQLTEGRRIETKDIEEKLQKKFDDQLAAQQAASNTVN